MERKISIKEAAELSGMCVGWWRKKIRDKEIAYYKLGSRTLIAKEDFDEFFAKSRVAAQK